MNPMDRTEAVRRFNNYISTKTLEGYTVVDKNESALIAVLAKQGDKVNHTLHAILTLVTCIWGIVWIVKATQAKKAVRIRVSIDESGNLNEEKVAG